MFMSNDFLGFLILKSTPDSAARCITQSIFLVILFAKRLFFVSALMTFNGVVSWLVYEMFEIEPKYLAATSARKHCGIKVKRGEKSKEVVLQHLLDNEPAFKISYTKYGNPKAESYDQADAIVVAKAGDIIEKGIEITEG